VPDDETRISLYQSLASTRDLENVAEQAKGFRDRFGEVPLEVTNLLYALKVKILAMGARLVSVSTEGGDIVLRRPREMGFDLTQLHHLTRPGLKLAHFQVRLNMETMGDRWQVALEEILKQMATDSALL
jgi:transcription-repair coupling factor (superfamily II helicase)